jgi:hypothetical protein
MMGHPHSHETVRCKRCDAVVMTCRCFMQHKPTRYVDDWPGHRCPKPVPVVEPLDPAPAGELLIPEVRCPVCGGVTEIDDDGRWASCRACNTDVLVDGDA